MYASRAPARRRCFRKPVSQQGSAPAFADVSGDRAGIVCDGRHAQTSHLAHQATFGPRPAVFALRAAGRAHAAAASDPSGALFTTRLLLQPVTALDGVALTPAWPNASRWAILRRDNGCLIGVVAIRRRGEVAARPSATGSGDMEPHVAVWAAHRGSGYAQEALRAVMWHAQRNTTGLSFVAVCEVHNEAADRLLRGVGFTADYEADAGSWRVRQYYLPSLWHAVATPG